MRKIVLTLALLLLPLAAIAQVNGGAGSGGASGIALTKTANYTVLTTDNGINFDNNGAAFPVAFTLPTAPASGQSNCYSSVAANPAQQVSIVAPSTSVTIWYNGASSTDFVTTMTNGTACITAQNATTWVVTSATGTWSLGVPAFYVATAGGGGSDSNTGTKASPFATPTKCQTAMRQSGTKTCYFRAGTYTPTGVANCWWGGNETCIVGLNSNDSGQTWSTYPPDGCTKAVIDGGSTSSGTGIFEGFSSDQNYSVTQNFTITCLTLQGVSNTLISFGGSSGELSNANISNITITNNILQNVFANGSNNSRAIECAGCFGAVITHNYINNVAGFGMHLGTNAGNLLLGGATVTGNAVINTCNGGANFHDCGGIYWQDVTGQGPTYGTAVLINNNFVRDGNMSSSDTGGGGIGSGIYLDNCTSNVLVTGNVVTGKSGGAMLQHNAWSNNTFSGNVLDLTGYAEYIMQYDPGNVKCGGMPDLIYPPQINNAVIGNLILGKGASSTGGYYWNGTHIFQPTVGGSLIGQANNYKTYGGNSIITSQATGSSQTWADANPKTDDPGFTGCYVVSATSNIHQAPVNFGTVVNGWGPPVGFTIPVSTGSSTPSYASPSC